MTILTIMVKNSGSRFMRFSVQRALASSLWFFFIIIALRNGAMMSRVSTPQTALPAQWLPVTLVLSKRSGASAKLNMTAMTATERMLYISVFMTMLRMSRFQLAFVSDVSGVPIVLCSNRRSQLWGMTFTMPS